MKHLNAAIFTGFMIALNLASCSSDPVQPTTPPKIVYLNFENEIVVWDAISQESETIFQVPENKPRVTNLWYKDENTLLYTLYAQYENLAILKETGDTLMCPCEDESDEWVVSGIVGSDRYDQIEYYMDTVWAISLIDQSHWIDKIVKYEHIDRKKVRIHTDFYDTYGRRVDQKDTAYTCQHVSYNYRGCVCEEETPERSAMYSESEVVEGVQYFTRMGHLFKREDGEEELLHEYRGQYFSQKMGTGFFGPTQNWDGSKVVLVHSESGIFIDWTDQRSDLLMLDVETNTIDTLAKDNFLYPSFSPDGNYVLLIKAHTWLDDEKDEVWVYEVKRDLFIEIGEGKRPNWLGQEPTAY